MTQKDNPLFQDSSISTGSNIRTQFELAKVCLHDGESLCLVLFDGKDKKISLMKNIDVKTGTYVASHWLKHRQEISYQFVIKDKEGVIFHGPVRKAFAMYTILEVWEPALEEDHIMLSEFTEDVIEHIEENLEEQKDADDVIENLIDKWGL